MKHQLTQEHFDKLNEKYDVSFKPPKTKDILTNEIIIIKNDTESADEIIDDEPVVDEVNEVDEPVVDEVNEVNEPVVDEVDEVDEVNQPVVDESEGESDGKSEGESEDESDGESEDESDGETEFESQLKAVIEAEFNEEDSSEDESEIDSENENKVNPLVQKLLNIINSNSTNKGMLLFLSKCECTDYSLIFNTIKNDNKHFEIKTKNLLYKIFNYFKQLLVQKYKQGHRQYEGKKISNIIKIIHSLKINN